MAYITFLLKSKLNLNPYDFYLDIFNEIFLLFIYSHFFYLIDGGIIYGNDYKIKISL